MYKVFEKYPRRWKLQEGVLERDFQRLCLDLSRFEELKNEFSEYTEIKSEMFGGLIANSKYLVSNETWWTKLNQLKSELTCKCFFICVCVWGKVHFILSFILIFLLKMIKYDGK